jgi:geranylgeranylglycerol-phosphate geranylgeranyltransferase
MAGAGVLVGAWWASGAATARVWVAGAAAVALAVAAYAWNDAADVDIDRQAHPDRPVARGRIAPSAAGRLAMLSAAAGVLLSAIALPWLGVLALAAALLMRGYSSVFKRRGIPGNVLVAVLASLPFLWGAWAAGAPVTGALLVLLAAPLHLAREIAKDLDDASGDAGRRATLPLTCGVGAARRAMVASLAAFLLLLWPLVARAPLFAAAVAPAILLAALAARHVWRGERGGPPLLKAAMLCAMAALVVTAPLAR